MTNIWRDRDGIAFVPLLEAFFELFSCSHKTFQNPPTLNFTQSWKYFGISLEKIMHLTQSKLKPFQRPVNLDFFAFRKIRNFFSGKTFQGYQWSDRQLSSGEGFIMEMGFNLFKFAQHVCCHNIPRGLYGSN